MRSSALASLIFFAAPVLAAAADSGPVVKDGVEITVVASAAAAGEPAGVVEATLDVEARTDAAALKLGFHSMRAVTAVDCSKGVNRFIKADAFAQSDLKGPADARLVSGDWVKPSDDSFMFGVTRRICGGGPVMAPTSRPSPPPGPLPVVTMGTPPAHTPPPPPPPPPTPAPVRSAAAAPRPVASAAPAAAFRSSTTGRGVAQVAASPTAAAAQHVLDRLRDVIKPPLAGSVEAATVQNAHIFRASVTGFVSLGDAQAFCARVASVSKTCWVHWKAGEPGKPSHP